MNPIACDGHGLCTELFPEWIRLDDWGYPIVRGEDVPTRLLPHARRAVAACPALAVELVPEEGGRRRLHSPGLSRR